MLATECADRFQRAERVALSVDSLFVLMAAEVSLVTTLESRRAMRELLSACQERFRRTDAVTWYKCLIMKLQLL